MRPLTFHLVFLSFFLIYGSQRAFTDVVKEEENNCSGHLVTIDKNVNLTDHGDGHRNRFCENKEPGFYAMFDDDCQSYAICAPQGFTMILQCPIGHLFDQITCSCVERNTSEWRPQPMCHKHDGVSHNHCGLDSTKLLKKKEKFCTGKGAGWYADVDRGCRYFGHCRHGLDSSPVFVKCPSRMIFSPNDNNCIFLKSGGDGVANDQCKSLSQNGSLSTCCHIPLFGFCPFLDPGCYANIFDGCRSYIQCVGSCATYYNTCPRGQIFDMTLCACVDEALAKCLVSCSGCACGSPTTTPPTTTTTPPTTTTTPPTTTSTCTSPTTTTPPPTTTTTPPTTTTTPPPTTTTPPPTTTTTPPTTTTTPPTTTSTCTSPTTTTPPTTTTTPPTTTTTPPTTTSTCTSPTTTTPPPTTTTCTSPTTTTRTPSSSCCPKSASGLFPDVSTYCTTYSACYKNALIKTYRCNFFSLFDVRECRCVTVGMGGKCLPSDQNECCVPPPLPTTPTTTSVSPTPCSNFCDGKAAGYYADLSRDCEWYFVCRGGSFPTTQMECPSHLRFSRYTCRCEFPSDVPCTIFDELPCPLVI